MIERMLLTPRSTWRRSRCVYVAAFACQSTLVGAAGSTVGGWLNSTGFSDCPCITPVSYLSLVGVDNKSGSDATCVGGREAVIQGEAACFAADHGSARCQAWDQNTHPACADPSGQRLPRAPEWCEKTWCYVAESCQLAKKSSLAFSNLWYSYGTCGSEDAMETWTVKQVVRRQTLRVHVMDYPPFGTVEGIMGGGILTDVFRDMADKASFEMVELPVMTPANVSNSSYTRCVTDVAWGHLDLCLGIFWETPQRWELASFITPFAVDNFRVMVKREMTSDSLAEDLAKMFKPFTTGLWITVMSAIIASSLGVFCLERIWSYTWREPDFHDLNHVNGVEHTVYLGFLGFFGAAPEHRPASPGGKLVSVTFGMIIMLVITGYTANLASNLVSGSEAKGAYTSIQDIVTKGKQLCILEAAHSFFITKHPRVAPSLLLTTTTPEAIDALNAGTCHGFIIGDTESEAFLRRPENCDKVLVGEPLMSLGLSQPINARFARSMSFWMLGQASNIAGAQARHQPFDRCVAKDMTKKKKTTLGTEEYGAIFICLPIATAIGAILNYCFARVSRLSSVASFSRSGSERPSQEPSQEASVEKPPSVTEEEQIDV